MLLLFIYLNAIETLICRKKISLIGSTSFGFAQNKIYDFQIPYWTHSRSSIVFNKCNNHVTDLGVLATVIDVTTAFLSYRDKP